jgi:molybdopterin converting factor small subunit
MPIFRARCYSQIRNKCHGFYVGKKLVEVRYKDYYESANIAGQTVGKAREQFKAEFGIPNKARAHLNGRKIKLISEPDTVLKDDDKLSFVVTQRRGLYLIGALLLAFAIAGANFAYGFASNSVTLGVTATGGDFASITAATGQPSWTVYGQAKGATGSGNLFVVDTSTSNYPGDLAVTVYLANVDQLAKVYRTLNLALQATSSNGTQIDVNADGVVDANDSVLLNLNNAEANFYIKQYTSSDNYTIKLAHGYYFANPHPIGGWEGSAQPVLYAEATASGIPSQTGTPGQYTHCKHFWPR